MSRSAPRNQRDLARLQRATAHEFTLGAKQQDIGMCCGEAVKTFFEYRIGAVDQLFHECPPTWSKVQINRSTDAFCIARELRGEVHDELFERAILLVVTELRYGHCNGTRARFAMGCTQPSGMRASIRIEERCPLGAGQMADFEDDGDMLRR